mgnify:CR=1 FL=1
MLGKCDSVLFNLKLQTKTRCERRDLEGTQYFSKKNLANEKFSEIIIISDILRQEIQISRFCQI